MPPASPPIRFSVIFRRFAILTLVWAVLVASAQAAPEPEDASASPAIQAVAPPDTPVGKQLAWVMSVLSGADPGALEGRFTKDMLEKMTADLIRSSLLEIRDTDLGGPPISLVEIEGNATDFAISGFVLGPRRKMNVFVAVDDESGLISGLRFSRAGYLYRRAGDWDAYQGDLGRRRGELSFGAYEVIDVAGTPAAESTPASPATSRLNPIHTIDDDKSLEIASASRVFILGALADATEQGRARWDEKLAIEEDLKSLPPGIMQGFKAGDEYPLTFFANRMIAINDHTAADHLLARLGREAVEAYLKGHCEQPDRNLPFLSTREAFQLRLPQDREVLELFAGSDEADRRTLLLPSPKPDAKADDSAIRPGRVAGVEIRDGDLNLWNEPAALNTVGWFASAHDLAQTLSDLRLASRRAAPGAEPGESPRPDPVATSLSNFSPIRLDRSTWPRVWYVGGGEPGTLSMNWLLERDDGRTFALCITWNNAKTPLEEDRLRELASVGIDLVAKFGRQPETPEDENK